MPNMSRLLSLEGENFMGYPYFRVDFDESNIVSFKGYNSAGKTTVLRAYAVINFLSWQTKLGKFIRHGQDSFKIQENFSDGVSILFEKFDSGKSAYHMMKDREVIFSTVENGVYSPVREVPHAVSSYLNFIDDSTLNLHFRRGREGLLLVDTSGKQNYDFISSALKVEKTTMASNMLKDDRISVKSEVMALKSQMDNYNELIKNKIVRGHLVDYMEAVDKQLSDAEGKKESISVLKTAIDDYNSLKPTVHLDKIETTRLESLATIVAGISSYNEINVSTSLDSVKTDRLSNLLAIVNGIQSYNELKPSPTVDTINLDKVASLTQIGNLLAEYKTVSSKIDAVNKETAEMKNNVAEIEHYFDENGIQVIKCESCGELQALGSAHPH